MMSTMRRVSTVPFSVIFTCQCLHFFIPEIYCWTSFIRSSSSISRLTNRRNSNCNCQVKVNQNDDFLDVEFEKTHPASNSSSGDAANTATRDENDNDKEENKDDDDDDDMRLPAPFGLSTSLIDVSLETGDPRWKDCRIPFCRGDEYIDCRLAFMVDLEGDEYGISVPFEDAVAIVVQEPEMNAEGTKANSNKIRTIYIDPDCYHDNQEYAELMEIFAVQVKEQLGEELSLRKTPKCLTISGGLDKITNNWQDKVITKPYKVEELLEVTKSKSKEEVDDDLKSFYEVMRSELGEEVVDQTMELDDNDIKAELSDVMKYFDVPGARQTTSDGIDTEGLEEIMQNLVTELETDEVAGARDFIADTENAALKLLGYTVKESGKSYFLVKPLKQCKCIESMDPYPAHFLGVRLVILSPLKQIKYGFITFLFETLLLLSLSRTNFLWISFGLVCMAIVRN